MNGIIEMSGGSISSAKRKSKILRTVYLTLVYIFLTLWALIALFPFVWVTFNSFKPSGAIITQPFALPNADTATVQNYIDIFTGTFNIGRAYFYSIYISCLVVLGTVAASALAAFAMARFRFRGKAVINVLIVACMMFPAYSLIFPMFRLLDNLMLIDTHVGLILPQIALNLGFTTILLTGFFHSLPIEVEESAYIDGSGILRTFVMIVLPMARSAIITSVIFVFLWSYNDLFLQSFIIQSATLRPIPYLLSTMTQQQGTNFGRMASASTLVAVPMLIVYFFLQRHIIKGLTVGAVKG